MLQVKLNKSKHSELIAVLMMQVSLSLLLFFLLCCVVMLLPFCL